MAFQVSPGVNVSEINAQTVVPNVGTSVGALAGPFQWGPVLEIRDCATELDLVNTFGKPNNDTATTWFSGANFLSYGGALKAVRVVGASGINSSTGSVGFLVKNETDYDNLAAVVAAGAAGATGAYLVTWVAKYPGVLGNSLQVSMADAASYANWAYKSYFQSAPGTSYYAENTVGNKSANDELHIVVLDQDGLFTGTAGSVLETFGYVSKASDAKSESGEDNYYVDVINSQSKYIWWAGHTQWQYGGGTAWGSATPSGATGFKGATGVVTQSLVNGKDDNAPSAGNLQDGYDLFLSETVECDLLISAAADVATVDHLIGNIAEIRKDCVVFVSPPKAAVVNNAGSEDEDTVTFMGTTLNANSSYAFVDGNWKYQYDRYNDVNRWIPCNGDVAGLCAFTDQVRDPWFSPAGYNRGVLKNVIKLAWNPSRPQRDDLYQIGVNPIIAQPGLGHVLFGDKTALAKPSPFDRINVRRLFIVLEKAISTAAKFSLFELNNTFTRNQFAGAVNPFLRAVQARDGIYDFTVICDETNNTAQVIDSNSFVGDIYIKPARSINFIQLNFVAVGTGVNFSEVVGQF